ncbi:hypothetical protein B6264_24250 [Kitasatospora aureofaciens]|nr:hypothetical protein B6264_24250 [Kitasatospora aureofaciens]
MPHTSHRAGWPPIGGIFVGEWAPTFFCTGLALSQYERTGEGAAAGRSPAAVNDAAGPDHAGTGPGGSGGLLRGASRTLGVDEGVAKGVEVGDAGHFREAGEEPADGAVVPVVHGLGDRLDQVRLPVPDRLRCHGHGVSHCRLPARCRSSLRGRGGGSGGAAAAQRETTSLAGAAKSMRAGVDIARGRV